MASSRSGKRAVSSREELSTVEHKRKRTAKIQVVCHTAYCRRGTIPQPRRERPCVELARAMLGCVLVCGGEGEEECRGEVVEVEAYLGGEDRAAHSYNGRRTAANEAMYMAPGTAYVYTIYGVHHCFNVSSQGPGAAVLVRALRPTAGLETMRRRRGGRGGRRDTELCSGPGKLCQALAIARDYDQVDLVKSPSLWLEQGRLLIKELIRESPRVGIDSAGEKWARAHLRFYLSDCRYVSKARFQTN